MIQTFWIKQSECFNYIEIVNLNSGSKRSFLQNAVLKAEGVTRLFNNIFSQITSYMAYSNPCLVEAAHSFLLLSSRLGVSNCGSGQSVMNTVLPFFRNNARLKGLLCMCYCEVTLGKTLLKHLIFFVVVNVKWKSRNNRMKGTIFMNKSEHKN